MMSPNLWPESSISFDEIGQWLPCDLIKSIYGFDQVDSNIVVVDHDDHNSSQKEETLACDVYDYLRAAETKNRPTLANYTNHITRTLVVDRLVHLAEEAFNLPSETVHLAINYMDRYLSVKEIISSLQQLQLVGDTCLNIASKYEEQRPLRLDRLCLLTVDERTKEDVLQMEADVLKCLKFEMSAPTAKCFLHRFVHVNARVRGCNDDLKFLADYIAELSLLACNVSYAPSLVAAACVFVANFILQPTKHPWSDTLLHYTEYQPCQLYNCVGLLYGLFRDHGPSIAIRAKYNKPTYKSVAKIMPPEMTPWIPLEYFNLLPSNSEQKNCAEN